MSGMSEEERVNGLHQGLCKLPRPGPPARLLPRLLGTPVPRFARGESPRKKKFSRLAPLISPNLEPHTGANWRRGAQRGFVSFLKPGCGIGNSRVRGVGVGYRCRPAESGRGRVRRRAHPQSRSSLTPVGEYVGKVSGISASSGNSRHPPTPL